MTKREKFEVLKGIVTNCEHEMREEMIQFINHEIELLNKKSGSTTKTKTQQENEKLIVALETALAEMEKPVTISEFQTLSTAEVATLSNQKLSALLKKCVDERKTVVKTTEKKKSYFSIARE